MGGHYGAKSRAAIPLPTATLFNALSPTNLLLAGMIVNSHRQCEGRKFLGHLQGGNTETAQSAAGITGDRVLSTDKLTDKGACYRGEIPRLIRG